MMNFYAWLEQTGLGSWIRESSTIWAYPSVLFMHTLGMGLVAGLSAAIALRILGFAREMPLSPLDKLYPVLWVGFWINAVSGTLLLIADATTKMTNPVFFIKLM